jgi:PAS domain S-box-containing protein
MTAKMDQFPAINSNPVLSVAKDGVVLYSNKAGEPLLHDWGVRVGEKVPPCLEIFVQRAISRKNIEKIEVTLGKKVYFIVFHLSPEQECVNVYGFDISGRKKLEGKPQESETQEKVNLELKANLELARIIDAKAVQSLMSDFYTLAHIPMGLTDLKGNVLVSVGWQDICTRFHRISPEACKHCIESDINLTAGVAPGGYKLYKCKNNMWDVVTPVMVEGQHVGNIFSGHFFFEDEPLNYELFRSQARKYGFNEEEYLKALDKVPRLSKEAVSTSMTFFMTFANMISQLSYSNIKLSQSLAERDAVLNALQESEKRERARSEELAVLLDAVPVAVYIAHDPQAFQITGNRLSYEWLRTPVGTNFSKSAPEGEKPETFKLLKDGVELQPEDMPSQLSATGIEINDCELDIVSAEGRIRHVLGNARPLRDEQGNLRGSISAFIDITERKKVEEALRLSNIYNRSLIEASLDPLVTIGRDGKITDVNGATEQVTGYSRNDLIETDFSDYFTEPEKARAGYQQVFKDSEVRDYPLEIRHKDGHITPVLYNASVYRDENGEVTGVFAAARDITERKLAEEALKKAHENLEKIVEERTAELEKAYISLKESEKGLAEAQKMAHIGNWEWDTETDKAYWSEEMYRIFKRAPQELAPPYNEFLNYIHPDDRDYVDNTLQKKAADGEKTHSVDYRIVLANKEERTVYMQSEAVFDEKNTRVRVKGIIQDITERKRSEEKLQILANAMESSNDAIVTLSLDGVISSWNKAAEQIYGYSAEEILGEDISILEPENIKGEIKQFSEKIKQGKNVQHYESTRLKKDGTIINISVTLSPIFDVTGKLVAISGIVRDVTERIKAEEALRESEVRLRQFYESDMLGVYYFNLDGSITDANDKLLEIIGYTREDLQAGKVNWNKMTPKEYRYLDERTLAELNTIGEKEPQEKEYIRKDGSHVPVIVGVATFDQARDEGIAFVLDITEKKKAEEALANLETARKKEIHHRIKNNLQVISSLLDLQADKFDNPRVIEAFRESQNRVISMALIHEELYKGEGTDTLDFSTYIRELAENLFQTYSLKSKNIHLSMDLEENVFLNMDTGVPLGIIVNELVSNSLKHAFPGKDKGEIQIKLHREKNGKYKKKDDKATSFILVVSDNGVGIPENLNIKDVDSLGIQLITTLADQLDGKFELKNNNGTEFIMRFTVTDKR